MKNACTVCIYAYDKEPGDPESSIAPGAKRENAANNFEQE